MILLGAALANTGWVESFQVGTGAIYATEPRVGIVIEEELLRLEMDTEPGRLAWRVVYDFEVSKPTLAPTGFPIDLRIEPDEGPPGGSRQVLEAFLAHLEDPQRWSSLNASWAEAHTRAREIEQIRAQHPSYEPPPSLWDEVRRLGPLRAEVPFSRLEALGVRGFHVEVHGRPVATNKAVLGELKAVDGGSLQLRLNIPLQLELSSGENLVELRWTTPGRTSRTHALQGWSTRYDFRPAKSWGTIGRFTLALDRELTRGAGEWALPWEQALPVGRFLVWTVEDWHPDAVLELDGRAPYLFDTGTSTAWERRVGATWAAGSAPTLPWTSPTASSTDAGTDPWFYDWDGWSSRNVGLGPANAVDGSSRTAWCAEEPRANLTLQLPQPAQGLLIKAGRRNPLGLVDRPESACPDSSLLDRETVSHGGCIVQTEGFTRVPVELVVHTADASYPLTLLDGDGLLEAQLAAGRIRIEAVHPDGPCLGEVLPIFDIPALLRPDLERPSARRQAGL